MSGGKWQHFYLIKTIQIQNKWSASPASSLGTPAADWSVAFFTETNYSSPAHSLDCRCCHRPNRKQITRVSRVQSGDIYTSGYQVKAGHHHRYERDTAPWHRVTAWQLSSCIKAPRSSPCYPPHCTPAPNDAIIQHIPLPWNSSIIYVYLAFDTGARVLSTVNSAWRKGMIH